MKQLLPFLAILLHFSLFAQNEQVSRDLQQDWFVYTDSGYVKFDEALQAKSVHIQQKASLGSGDYLKVKSTIPFSLFVDQQLLWADQKSLLISIDSLRRALAKTTFTISIYSKEKIEKTSLLTQLVRYPLVASKSIYEKRPSAFLTNFVLIGASIILLLLILIVKLNPKLASDYFSVSKIFSMRESEDNIVYTRITSSGNFLFFGFSSLTIAFFLLLLFVHLPDKLLIKPDSLPDLMRDWLLLSLLVILIFSVKMLTIYLFATLFQLRDVAGMQFFNWTRLFFLFVGFSVSLLTISILTRTAGPGWINFFYMATGSVLVMWIVLAFFKIAAKARISPFHLFSYLCATEIIPSLIILKILYY
ncbi:DUF4271 domain-containing protein [Chryseotalea sanaruensis]|uniref:DUF4271 domain-containing protein n=1 Tax=Chryseotalea sanaruensis TaxID=2482724 RepID=UPI00135BDC2B|nr:DUF4271 domain-containing protein [Chryseotalea sanaruensis]